ncbi:MAG TPA: universal stress protein [Silvibacterium sp.]|nr:universal stress protein [Silvibacterium sp.]
MTTTTATEITFKEILVASDLSDASLKATDYAEAIAKRFGSHIVLAHVSDPGSPIAIPEGGWIQEAANLIEKQMQAAAVALRAEGLAADAVNTYGGVKQELEALADANHSDLVVLGTHGRRGLKRFLFGSEAEGLLRGSDRPVLTVGPAVAPVPTGAWTPRNVLCATSLNLRAAQVVAYGYRLARSLGASFELLSVDDANRSAKDEPTWRAFEDALAQALPEEAGRCQIRSLQSGKSPAENIVDVARTLKSDLIVMGAKASHFTTTHMPAGVLAQVLIDAPCPVLTLRTE